MALCTLIYCAMAAGGFAAFGQAARPDLLEKKESLVLQISEGRKTIQELEDKILHLLATSGSGPRGVAGGACVVGGCYGVEGNSILIKNYKALARDAVRRTAGPTHQAEWPFFDF